MSNPLRLIENNSYLRFPIDGDFFNDAFKFIAFPDIKGLYNGFWKSYLVGNVFSALSLGYPGLNFNSGQFFHHDLIIRNRYKKAIKIFDNEIDIEKLIILSVQKYISKKV